MFLRRFRNYSRPAIWTGATVVAYTGPGDVISGASAWYGLRGYNAAYTGNAVTINDQSGANATTITILSGGNLDLASINSWVTAHSVTTIKVTTLFDQSGNNLHVFQTTLSKMPTINLTAGGATLAGIACNDSIDNQVMTSTTALVQTAPYNFSAVFNQQGEIGFSIGVISLTAAQGDLAAVGTNGIQIENGNGATVATATNNTIHAINASMNGASGAINVDGTEVTSNITNVNLNNAVLFGERNAGDGRTWNGFIFEAAVWPTGWSSSQRANIRTNQKNYWGTP